MDTRNLLLAGGGLLAAYALLKPWQSGDYPTQHPTQHPTQRHYKGPPFRSGGPDPVALPPVPLNPPAASTGLITPGPTLPWVIDQRYGTPVPTDAWDHATLPGITQGGELNLDAFPSGDLPSGGESSRISPSEMAISYAMIGSQQHSVGPIGTISMTWTRVWPDASPKILFSSSMDADPSWWWAWMYSFIGRFSWEVDRPGLYQCRMASNLGALTWQFRVTGSGVVGGGGVGVGSGSGRRYGGAAGGGGVGIPIETSYSSRRLWW